MTQWNLVGSLCNIDCQRNHIHLYIFLDHQEERTKHMKTAKKIFKIVGIILGIIILALIGYIIYLFASYHRIEDNLPLEVESHAADAELTTEQRCV